jgi:hypothetical protein
MNAILPTCARWDATRVPCTGVGRVPDDGDAVRVSVRPGRRAGVVAPTS